MKRNGTNFYASSCASYVHHARNGTHPKPYVCVQLNLDGKTKSLEFLEVLNNYSIFIPYLHGKKR